MPIRYTPEHEWIAVEGDVGTVGITAHAADQLGDVVFVEAQPAGAELAQGAVCGVVESTKAASDIYAPVSGAITETNPDPVADPALLNRDPEGAGWLFRMRLSDPGELDGLLDADAYRALVGA